ncbi:MAG: hypothetical protein JSS63_09925 [Bacteroidetes bacterium]|nr:hypothetical protein [Bacteroidota bacterium]
MKKLKVAPKSKRLFRESSPTRTCTRVYASYTGYKKYLAKDFNYRCGYTNCLDHWFGGRRNFQIDHFKSIKYHPDLINNYSNLVYSCSYVNRAKSDDDNDFLDPCNDNYNDYFYRDDYGNIYPENSSDIAKKMFLTLKLYLRRYSLIWLLEKLENSMEILKELIEKYDDEDAQKLFVKVGMKYMDYKKYLRSEL